MSTPPIAPENDPETALALDPANPWPGLYPFREKDALYFFGREDEADELFRRVTGQRFTLLYGGSGFGKTSLLRAALYPRLRAEGFLPLELGLDVQSPNPLSVQTARQVAATFSREWPNLPPPRSAESLWSWLHRAAFRFQRPDGTLALPVLIFDQFEEIFTLGSETEVGRERARAFLGELAEMVANRDQHPASQGCRVLISVREDFLHRLEPLIEGIPGAAENAFRLLALDGLQAMAAVQIPGERLVTPVVSRQIVRSIAQTRREFPKETTPNDKLDYARLRVNPSLLGVVCRELNRRRQQRGLAQITHEVVLSAGLLEEMVSTFYEEAIAEEGPAVRAWVEDRLVTESGVRNRMPLKEAEGILRVAKGEPQALERLVTLRLLRIEDRLTPPRIELAHDALIEAVAHSRDERQAREAIAALDAVVAVSEPAKVTPKVTEVRRQTHQVVTHLIAGLILAALIAFFALAAYHHAAAGRDLAERQRRNAEEALAGEAKARAAAESALRIARNAAQRAEASEKAASQLIASIQYSINDFGYAKVTDEVNARVRRFRETHPSEAGAAAELRVQSMTLLQRGDQEASQGLFTQALDSYQQALALTQKMVHSDPEDQEGHWYLAGNYSRVGDMQRALKMLPEARESYRARLAIMVTLTEQDPENTGWQRDLSVSYAKVGDVQVADGQYAEAAQSYQQSLAILEALIKREPSNAEWQEDLVLTYDRVGETALRQQQWDAAAKSFGLSIELSRPHIAQKEIVPNWVRDFAFDAGRRWEVLRDAPAGSVTIDRAAALADLRTSQEDLKKLSEAGRLMPPMDKTLAWIDKLILDSEHR